ncbi:ligase-associated DNA damage response endonuclease PdeM [Mesorhizobium sp. RP14(2022)]|uniref:Ligase-associated DNA damage response endonuclease PdeM n=1 Tax=Mesorhizobium liriopis TaxID=2953882 RepID=A0ABT1C0K3_9HYPH|nr:ligase-associated DNA damage response endonuclease PdeM [Mesorhizobium liriopis]MCO6048307.1 ligase-associated DNA damage response endonuclease PdeM [Mesorhizobium liriopis]
MKTETTEGIEGRGQAATSEALLHQTRVVCDHRGVLFLPDYRTLVVSDLHLEKGSSFARRGMFLPPYDTAATLKRLCALVEEYAPRTVISLGDSFHDTDGPARLIEPFRSQLADLASGREWFWITGNHDPHPPGGLPGETFTELRIAGLIFRHEPQENAEPGEVAGHLHPCAKIVARGRGLRRRCFASDGARMILPAFGSLTGSLNVLDRAYAKLFAWERFTAHMMGGTRMFAVPRTLLYPG